jgi:hypothetical protein
MKTTLALGCLSLAALAAPPERLGVTQATGYFKADSRPTLYQPLNLLDGRDATAWCSPGGDPLNEYITIGFNGPIRLEELRITTGNAFDDGTFQQFSRARKIEIRAGKAKQVLMLEDQKGPQTVSLPKPMEGSRFRIEVLDLYPGDDIEAPVCVTDIVFVGDSGKAFNGPWLTTKLKYDKHVQNVMGTWFAGYDKTPDRFLHLNYDGTFRYSFEPFDTTRAKEKVLEGRYDAAGGRFTFDVGGKKYPVRVSKDPSKKGGFTLTFDGPVPDELKGPFRSVP